MKSTKHLILVVVALLMTACAYTVGGPQMRNVTQCPKHEVALQAYSVPTRYGLIRESVEYSTARATDFPYAAEPAGMGCVVGLFSWMNRHERVRACPACTAAWRAYEAAHGKDGGVTSNLRLDQPVIPVTPVAVATGAPVVPAGHPARYTGTTGGDAERWR